MESKQEICASCQHNKSEHKPECVAKVKNRHCRCREFVPEFLNINAQDTIEVTAKAN